MSNDEQIIADAFRQMYSAAMKIDEVLGRRDDLNTSVPASWPLNYSSDEFASECQMMQWHYEALAKA